jgi:hypothetical protein
MKSEAIVITVDGVVDKKRIIRKNGGPRSRSSHPDVVSLRGRPSDDLAHGPDLRPRPVAVDLDRVHKLAVEVERKLRPNFYFFKGCPGLGVDPGSFLFLFILTSHCVGTPEPQRLPEKQSF